MNLKNSNIAKSKQNNEITNEITSRNSAYNYKTPVIIFVLSLVIFAAVSADRLETPSRDNHYVHMAKGMLEGRFHLEGKPPHYNDFAKYNGKWYISFPPLPAVLMLPGVAIFGMEFNDRIFTIIFSAASPALLFLLLQMLTFTKRISRSYKELWLLTILFAFGSVYFFSAVQGSVWYTAHMVGMVMMLLFLIFSIKGKHPVFAGLFLGLAFLCRPSLLMAFPFFIYESLRENQKNDIVGSFNWIKTSLQKMGAKKLSKQTALFILPLILIFILVSLFNYARFDDLLEFGHRYLKVRQTHQIAKWGLFNYHYLGHNLSVIFSSLPWVTDNAPFVKISLHGLAIWVTTPVFFWLLWPKYSKNIIDTSRNYNWLAFTLLLLAIPSLFYQNSGWVQFGQRFSLDYLPILILMLAMCGQSFKKGFIALLIFSIAINLFGALTFDRSKEYYAFGKYNNRVHQPH